MPEPRQQVLRRTWVRRAIPVVAVAVLAVAGTIVVQTNASATPTDTYRTTPVTNGSVEQRLNLTGSVEQVNQTTQSFAVTGTVSSVSVSVGDHVRVGQILATVDPAPLRSAVTDANAALAQAKATLESDQSAASTSTTASTSSTASTATTTTPTKAASTTTVSTRAGSPSGTGSGAGTAQGLARAQRNVASAQRIVTADLARASAALAQCAPFFPTAAPVPAPTATTTTTTTTATPTTTPTTTPTGPSDAAVKACLNALATAPTPQKIQQDEQAFIRSQADLAKAVALSITTASKSAASAATTSSGSTSRSATSQATASQSSGQASGSQASGARTGTTNQSSAARIVSDKAAITIAESTLSSAKADLAAASLKASIAGTVGSVSLVKGTSSNGENVVIVGAGPAEVTIDVPLASMAGVHVGQKANVTPHGATGSVSGAVTSISLLPSTSTSTSTSTAASRAGTAAGTGQATATASSPTYPVVVRVPQALPALASGARAEVSLLIGTATNVVTVPNSALTPLGNGQAIALTFKDGVTTRALVRTGYAGTLTTNVTSGLTAGQQVVLADLNTPLPTNTTNARRFGVGVAPGGLGGAGLGGAVLGGGTGAARAGFIPGG